MLFLTRAAPLRQTIYDERSSPCFCDAGDAVAGTVFEEEHQGQGDGEGADEEVQGDGITIGIFFDERQDQGTGDAGSAPGREDAAVDGTEVFRTEEALR